MSRTRTPILLTAAAAVLAACASGPDFKRPEPPQAGWYVAPAEQGGNGQTPSAGGEPGQDIVSGAPLPRTWWRLFRSPALDEVVEHALTGNRTLAAAQHTLAQAQALAEARAGGLSPEVDITAGLGRQKLGAQALGDFARPPAFTYFALGPTVSYTLDYRGGVARSVEQQYALAEYQRQQREAAFLAVSGGVVMQSLKIASLRAQLEALEAILEQDRENLKLVQVAFDAGSVSRLDIVSAQSQLASDTALLAPLRQQMSLARHALAVLLGTPPAQAQMPQFDLARIELPRQLPVSLPSELAHRRPDILAAEAQLHAATAAVGVAEANLYPRINLSAAFGLQSTALSRLFDRDSATFGLSGGLLAPLFEGGRLKAERRAADEAMQASLAQYQQTVLTAFGQVADALQALQHDAEQLEAQTQAQAAARDNLDLTRKSYAEGNVGVLQVLDAERLYQQARLGFVRAQGQRYLDTAQLLLALGGGRLEEAQAAAGDPVAAAVR